MAVPDPSVSNRMLALSKQHVASEEYFVEMIRVLTQKMRDSTKSFRILCRYSESSFEESIIVHHH